jgi:thioredoxin reductase (NADPH)
MKLPIIFLLDDDERVLRALQRDLKKKYHYGYRILSTTSPLEALEVLKELKLSNENVALIISDQRMPELEGVEFLEKALEIYPETRKVLLTAYSDIQAAIKAINDLRLDYYLLKPWDPPEEKLFPVIDELIEEWAENYKPVYEGIKLIGFQWSQKSHMLKDFLSSNLVPYKWINADVADEADEYMKSVEVSKSDLPVIIFDDGTHLTNPDIVQVATKLGHKLKAATNLYDVVIIGAGPSGLAASVYGASEGLKTLLIEKKAPGGQAGTSSRIENYLGFPSGLSGAELSRRALTQAARFGTEILSPVEVKGICANEQYKLITLSDDTTLISKAVVITTGVSYRLLDVKNVEKFTGAGVFYGAANTEANAIKGKPVYIIGGGNSAGQAALFLTKFASDINIIIRGNTISTSMSSYLVEQITTSPKIKILSNTEIMELHGDGHLEGITLLNKSTNVSETVEALALFVFIGAKPSTTWIDNGIVKDEKGFIITGRDLLKCKDFTKNWKLKREPYLLETSMSGVFASGDVRSGAMARVASAVGEGSMAIKFTHQYLAEI